MQAGFWLERGIFPLASSRVESSPSANIFILTVLRQAQIIRTTSGFGAIEPRALPCDSARFPP